MKGIIKKVFTIESKSFSFSDCQWDHWGYDGVIASFDTAKDRDMYFMKYFDARKRALKREYPGQEHIIELNKDNTIILVKTNVDGERELTCDGEIERIYKDTRIKYRIIKNNELCEFECEYTVFMLFGKEEMKKMWKAK